MTVAPAKGASHARGLLLAGLLAALPVHAALAWQQTPPAQRAPVYVPSAPAVQFQQSMQQQQLNDQMQKNRVEQQLHQSRTDTMKRAGTTDPTQTSPQANQLDQANRAQGDLYRARQQDLIDRSRHDSLTPAARPVVRQRPTSHPAPARSGG